MVVRKVSLSGFNVKGTTQTYKYTDYTHFIHKGITDGFSQVILTLNQDGLGVIPSTRCRYTRIRSVEDIFQRTLINCSFVLNSVQTINILQAPRPDGILLSVAEW